ncbi:MAG: hypothetical protein DRP58_07130 [Spirochaetes bacterium]|nr:MAG: hypothetical protein DRP58_07130 [Spirochaetota bacterium]
MSFGNILVKLFQLVLVISMALVALYVLSISFFGTNIFATDEYFITIGEIFKRPVPLIFLYFSLIAPLIATGGYAILTGSKKMMKLFGSALGVFFMPSLLAHSKFNWLLFLDKSLGLSAVLPFEDILAMTLFIVSGYIFLLYSLQLGKLKQKLLNQGSVEEDVSNYLGEGVLLALIFGSIIITVLLTYSVNYFWSMMAVYAGGIPFNLWVVGIGFGMLIFVALYFFIATFRSAKPEK